MDFIDSAIIEMEEKSQYKPLALQTTAQSLPYNSVGDRNFEILIYRLFTKEKPDIFMTIPVKVELMEGVADHGRDVCFVGDTGQIIGVVQCKNWKDKITRPKLISEILKLILFFIQEGTNIIPNNYWIVCPAGLTSEAKKLIRNFSSEIIKDDIKAVFIKLKEEYVSFSEMEYSEVENSIIDKLACFTVYSLSDVDITKMLMNHPDILSMHFQTVSLIDIDNNARTLEKIIDDRGLRLLTDCDLKILQKRIGETPEDARIRMLGVDVYGVNIRDLDFSKEEPQDFFRTLIEAQSILKKILMGKISETINKEILEKITGPLLMTGKIHQNSVQFAAPFITRVLLDAFQSTSLPKGLMSDEIPIHEYYKNLEDEITKDIVDTSQRIMNGDYSTLAGSPDIIIFKIKVYKTHLLLGFTTITELEQRLKSDIVIMMPEIMNIIHDIQPKYTIPKTIVIHDLSIWDSKEYMEQTAKTVNISNKKGKSN